MASDLEIADSLDSLLRDSPPGSITTLNDVLNLLQSRLGFDLSHKIDFIRARVTAFYSPRHRPPPPPPPQTPIFAPNPHPQYQLQYPQRQGPVFRNTAEISFSQPSPNPNVAAPAAQESSQRKPKRRGGTGGLNKPCGVSPELQKIVGQSAMPRTEIVRELWAYIRKYNLQDPSNKRKIICNDELRVLFETDSTDMFQMNKLLAKHILRLDPSKESDLPQSKKAKVDDEPEVKKIESGPNVLLSDALASFLGTSGREMPQAVVFTLLSEYIKAQGLEDSENSVVLCDTKLRELFGCESVPTAGIYDMLANNHLSQKS